MPCTRSPNIQPEGTIAKSTVAITEIKNWTMLRMSEREHNAHNAFRVPKELVNIVVSDNGFMILVASHEFPVDDLVALVPDKSVKRLHHSSQIKPLGNMVESVLALWRPVIVIRTLEDEAEAFGSEPHLRRFAPAEKVESDLSQAVVLAHVVHSVPPSIMGCGKGLFVRWPFTACRPQPG